MFWITLEQAARESWFSPLEREDQGASNHVIYMISDKLFMGFLGYFSERNPLCSIAKMSSELLKVH